MDNDVRREREVRIFRAAYELLAEHGYGATSMLRIAKASRASNETLYRWYGNKDGLFKEMVRANASETKAMLTRALEGQDAPWTQLEKVAPVFLRMILGEQAILLNRAAAADPTGALGAAISAGGRAEIMPLFGDLMQRICAGRACDPKAATGWFISLLVGDLQIRRVINDLAPLSEQDIQTRCGEALPALAWLINADRI